MNVLSSFDAQLIALNKRGIIAYIGEDRETFIARAQKIPPFPSNQDLSYLEKTYALTPDWVKLIYSNDFLRFWEGGCTWEESDTTVIQLRETFKRHEKLYCIYHKEEILSHELVHAVRAPLQSQIFEEFFAYQTSKSRLRRFLGPILRSPQESVFYLLTLLGFLLFPFWPLIQGLFLFLNLLLLCYGLYRLYRTWSIFNRVKKKLSSFLPPENLLPFMVFLKDEEMILFSKATTSEILDYLKRGSYTDVRLEQLVLRFLDP